MRELSPQERLYAEVRRVRERLRSVGASREPQSLAGAAEVRAAATVLRDAAVRAGDSEVADHDIPELPPTAWQHLIDVLVGDAVAAGAPADELADTLESLRRRL